MTEWIVAFITQNGYVGIAALMLIENLFPPIPSELIMPFAGFAAADGGLHVAGVIAAGTFGSVLGTLPWYAAGRLTGAPRLKRWAARHGRWLTLEPSDIDTARDWFDRHGVWAVLFGRLLPAVRSVISVPAGLACMPLVRFLGWSTAGSLIWVGALTSLGYALRSQYVQVGLWIDPATKGVLALVLLGYLWRVVRFGSKSR